MAPQKRKRSDRTSVDGSDNRPSPHRPGNPGFPQHDRDLDSNRRQGRGGGRGGGNRIERRNSTNPKYVPQVAAPPTPGQMSPPSRPPSAVTPSTPVPAAPSTSVPVSNVVADEPAFTPSTPPAPYDYAFITEERVSAWEIRGRQEVVDAGKQALKDEDAMDLCSLFQELIRASLDGRIGAADGGSCIRDILGPNTGYDNQRTANFDPQTLFLDTLSMVYDAEDGPFSPLLRVFTVSTEIPPLIMRQKLDAQLLQNLGLTRDTFIRVGIRQATHLLYRQANYNLLREETEGYSKLLTELFTTSASEPPSSEAVEDAFERLKGLIGTFDLDVGRVLDITLDVFAAVLIKHFRFFIKLLRVSSWWPRNDLVNGSKASLTGLPNWALPSSQGWTTTDEDEELSRKERFARDTSFWARAQEVGLDAFFELGGRRVVDETSRRIMGEGPEKNARFGTDRQWIEETGTYPPSGNRTAAQLLGFKLRFYTSEARDKDDILPANLIYLTALLIKIGFISLRDLYPHLWPLDENMEAVREARMKELAEKERLNRPGGGANALMLAGALADDTLPNNGRAREANATKPDSSAKSASVDDVEDADKLDEPTDQKVQLLTCLLTIGAIPESLFILGRFPWLPEAYPELLDLIHRIASYSIKDVYNMTRPTTSQEPECSTKRIADLDQNGMPKGQVRLVQIPTRKLLRWPFPDKFDTNDNNSYRFYWDEWADNIPVCQSVDDVFTLCSTFLNYSGVNIGKDPSLLSKLARIGTKSLSDDRSPENLARWQDLLKRLLVPALSLTKSNTSVVNEIYDMLRFYPVSVRYSIYAEWFEGQTSRLPAMRTAFARARLETLSTMKRISMTNLTTMARTLAKTAYACPGIVFSVALSQIEAYTNLTEVVVECAKYFTDLGYDVLVWSLMSSLGGKDRNRTNAEFALLPSRWLLALSRFSGKVFRRYSIMNVSPVLQYVNDQLYRGNSTDLVILKELIAQMAGVVPDTDFTDAQITAMTGGELLRRQTLINLQDKRYESTKTAKRLMKALTETKLAGQLLLSIAQHRQSAIYTVSDDEAHIKMLATMIDDTQLILFQYLDLLRSNLSVEEFDEQVPGIPELLTEFGLQPNLAFMIGRTSLMHRLTRITSSLSNGTSKSPSQPDLPLDKIDSEGDVGMMDVSTDSSKTATDQPTASDVSTAKDELSSKELGTSEETTQSNASQLTTSTNIVVPSADAFLEILEPVTSTVQTILPETTWKAITPEFYTTFWSATLGDLAIPSSSYELEISRLLKEQGEIMKDRTDMTRAGIDRKEAAKKALESTREALLSEFGKQVGVYKQTKARLLSRKAYWFPITAKADLVSDAVLESCLIPRLVLSPSDADFCFKMIRFLHDNGPPNFRTLSLLGRIFRANRLRTLIFTSTVREAENLGRFLRLLLSDLARWHADSAVYEKEAWGPNANLPGFAKALDQDGKPKGFLDHDDGKISFKGFLFTFHKNLNTALRECLEGTEWMHIRNAITILKSVVEVFPAIDFMGRNFIKQLESVTLREKGAREDLSLTGNAVLVQLKKRSSQWIMVQAFGSNIVEPGQMNGMTVKPATPPKSSLNANAPTFQPSSRASSRGDGTARIPNAAEVEDGEVDDARVTSTDAAATANPTTADVDVVMSGSKDEKGGTLSGRDTSSRGNTPKPSIPSTTAGPQSRNDIRGSDRSHNLPSRPDAPLPSRQDLERHTSHRHGDRRDIREPRAQSDLSREDRHGGRLREFTSNGRRSLDGPLRDSGRLDRPLDRERLRPEPPPRWTPESAREHAERVTNGNRMADPASRRENAMLPPRSSGTPSDRGLGANSDRTVPINPDRLELINPERASLISGDSPRHLRDDFRDRPSSRPESPRRFPSDREKVDPRRDDRSNRSSATDSFHSSRSRYDDSLPPPAGPRGDRSTDGRSERGIPERVRDVSAFQQTPPTQRSLDPDHGRLNASPRPPADPNFGRLNQGPSVSDIPSGPRDRSSRGNRMSGASQRRDIRPMDPPRPPTPDKQPPTGPSSNWHSRRATSGQFDTSSAATPSTSTAPSTPSSTPVVHPDRLRQLGVQAVQPTTTPQPLSSPETAGIHPDRLKAFGNEAPNQPGPNRTRPSAPPIITGPPSGPKVSQSSPVTPGANGLAAPTGPASATDRAVRGGRRQLAGINNMLQQAGQQNLPDRDRIGNIRGRSNRMNAMGQPDSPIHSNAGQGLPIPPPPPPPVRLENRDLGTDLVNPQRADLITGVKPTPEERGYGDRDRQGRRDRSGRHSRRTSRSRSQDRGREAKVGAVDDERGPRPDHRDRRTRDPERERYPRAEAVGGRDATGGRDGREGGKERDRERDSTRRDGRERDPTREVHEASWGQAGERGGGGRNRDMRAEGRTNERRESRGSRDDGGRKRRSEEPSMDGRGHEKRARR
ncbi:transcription factor/nuclear export subunit protein 2-domain-containing protein [Xylogone sp. PMI_703]|nr:transcription factor/nuclear export subunit protein 2-domain-containing protein [Xylogone sp. PMI_703]